MAHEWYVVRTKVGKERWVGEQLNPKVSEVFVPFLRVRRRRASEGFWSLEPLFPCYLFARFDLVTGYFEVQYVPGVIGLIRAGADPIAIPARVVDELRRRASEGVVEVHAGAFEKGARVRIMEGPFMGFEAIFERYVSRTERVAILLREIQGSGVRVVLDRVALSRAR